MGKLEPGSLSNEADSGNAAGDEPQPKPTQKKRSHAGAEEYIQLALPIEYMPTGSGSLIESKWLKEEPKK